MSGPARRLVGRRVDPPSLLLAGAAAFFALAAAPPAPPELPELPLTAFDIPAFARMYRTSCSTCHTAAPKLNVLGEAFRLNGYRLRRSHGAEVLYRYKEMAAIVLEMEGTLATLEFSRQ